MTFAVIKKRSGAKTFLIGFLLFGLIAINDMLHNNHIINTGIYGSLGLLCFLFSQAYYISIQFSKAFSDIEDLSVVSDDTDIDFTEKITINENRGRSVGQYDLNMNLIKKHDSIAEAAKDVCIHKNNIWGVINNYRKTAGEFIWKYLD